MIACNILPPGWKCSRYPGHEGPCAASPAAQPYEEYVDGVVKKNTTYITPSSPYIQEMSTASLRELLADAWVAGLINSLDLIEKEKEKR